MPEALISGISVVFAFVGIITTIYCIMIRIVLLGNNKNNKILLIFTVDDGGDATVAGAVRTALYALIRTYPVFFFNNLEIHVCSDEENFAELLETEESKRV